MLRSVDLSDYMLQEPVKVKADDDLFTAIDLITNNRISGVCVVDNDNILLGVLSELDCLRAILSSMYNQDSGVGMVSEFMTEQVDTCNLHDDVVDVAADMLAKGHRRRPVIDNGVLVGLITCRQLLKVVSHFNE